MMEIDLKRLEGCRVLYCVESGSRAYGFDSPDSDFDVRGIYVQPWEKYVSLGAHKDQISWVEEDRDFVFWDIRKVLKLLMVSNPSVLDWLSSPIVYLESDAEITRKLRSLAFFYFSPSRFFRANYGLSAQHYRKYIFQQDRVKTKVYLYTLRALAACRYVDRERTPPPIDFAFSEWFPEAKELIARKRGGTEKEAPPASAWLDQRIANGLKILKVFEWEVEEDPPVEVANDFLISLLK